MRFRLSASFVLATLLAGCGVTWPWSGDVVKPVVLTVEPMLLQFEAFQGDPAPAGLPVVVTASRADAGICVEWQNPPIADVLAQAPGVAMIQVVAPDAVGVGTSTGQVAFIPCEGPDGTPSPGASAVSVEVRFTVKPNPLSLSAPPSDLELVFGGPAASGTSTFSSQAGPGPWTAEATFPTACQFATLSVSPASGQAVPATLTVTATETPWASQEGVCTGELRVSQGGRTIGALVTVHGRYRRLALQPSRLDFAGVSHQLPLAPPQVLSVTPEFGTIGFLPRVSASAASWLAIDPSSSAQAPGTIRVVITSSDLAPGAYSGNVEVSSFNAPVVTIPVTYALEGRALRASPPQWTPFISEATVPADLSLLLGLTDSGTPLAWTATSSASWLEVSPPAGTTGAGPGPTLSVSPATLETLPFGLNEATVSVRYALPGSGNELVTVPVALHMGLQHVVRVMPRTVVAGAPGPATLYCAGSDGYTHATNVEVGGRLATLDSWGSVTTYVTLPDLPAGTYPVSVQNQLGLRLSQASLQVIGPVTRAATAVASTGRKTQLAFDDASGTLYAANPGAGTVERFREAAGWARDAVAIAGLRDAALSPEGTVLAAAAGAGVSVIDTARFTLASPQPTALVGEPGAESFDWRIAYGADGLALLIRSDAEAGLYLFDGAGLAPPDGTARWWGQPGVSGNGKMIWIARRDVPPLPLAEIMPGWSPLWTPGAIPFTAGHVAADRGARKFLFQRDGAATSSSDTLLVDTAYLGAAPGRLPPTIANAVPTQDGLRAIAWDPVAGQVRVFDLGSAPDAVSGLFKEPGAGIDPASPPGGGAVMTLSVDDRTLFLAGDQALVVVPLP
jgi:hypothetical protein